MPRAVISPPYNNSITGTPHRGFARASNGVDSPGRPLWQRFFGVWGASGGDQRVRADDHEPRHGGGAQEQASNVSPSNRQLNDSKQFPKNKKLDNYFLGNKKIPDTRSQSPFFSPPLLRLFFFFFCFASSDLVDAFLSVSSSFSYFTARFVLFTAGTGDDRTPKDEDAAAPSEENATETPEKKSESEEEDKEARKLQSPEHARGGAQEGSDAAEVTQHRPGEAREASEDPPTKKKTGVVEGGKYYKVEEDDEEDDDDEVQTEVSFEGSGVGVDGVDDMEQREERRGVLGPQEELALFAEYKAHGGPRTGGVDVVPGAGGGGRHALGGEPAEWSAQRMAPAQQLGEPSEEVRGRARGGIYSRVACGFQNVSQCCRDENTPRLHDSFASA